MAAPSLTVDDERIVVEVAVVVSAEHVRIERFPDVVIDRNWLTFEVERVTASADANDRLPSIEVRAQGIEIGLFRRSATDADDDEIRFGDGRGHSGELVPRVIGVGCDDELSGVACWFQIRFEECRKRLSSLVFFFTNQEKEVGASLSGGRDECECEG